MVQLFFASVKESLCFVDTTLNRRWTKSGIYALPNYMYTLFNVQTELQKNPFLYFSLWVKTVKHVLLVATP